MKILYAIQGTGNGHVARANFLRKRLEARADVDFLLSGTESALKFDGNLKYHLQGLSYKYGSDGQIKIWKSLSSINIPRLLKELWQLPVKKYDLVICDFEGFSSMACRLQGVACVGVGHQYAYLSDQCPRPREKRPVEEWILRNYAPAQRYIGFHFKKYDDFIETPILGEDIRQIETSDLGHISVYLPSYSAERLHELLKDQTSKNWQIFTQSVTSVESYDHIEFHPISRSGWLNSMANSGGVLAAAGFEGPAEVLHLGKKLCVIPIANQYEQHCNAAALEQLGVKVLQKLTSSSARELTDWYNGAKAVHIPSPDNAEEVIDKLMNSCVFSP